MGSIAPITATQFGTNRIAEQWLRALRRTNDAAAHHAASSAAELSGVDRFACAAVAGGVSAAVATPTELIIIQQQKRCSPLAATVREFTGKHNAPSWFRGLAPCVGRETLYAAGYLGLCPVLYDVLRAREDPLPATQAMAVAGVVGGVFAAAASHPFDTS
jgi:solute carrier family 25 (mitochondrial citrate transporter), member 1